VVADEAVGLAALFHVGGDVGLVAVDESGDDVAVFVQFGDGVKLIFGRSRLPASRDTCTSMYIVQEALRDDSVDFFADSSVLAIDEVINDNVAGQDGFDKVAGNVVAAWLIMYDVPRTPSKHQHWKPRLSGGEEVLPPFLAACRSRLQQQRWLHHCYAECASAGR